MPIIQTDGENIYYQVIDGRRKSDQFDAVVLLHSLGTDSKIWRYQIEMLAEHSPNIVLIDTRGHGQSTNNGTFTMEACIQDINSICTQLNFNKVVLCGVSMGGVQAMGFTAKYPNKVKGLILADTFARIEPDQINTKIKLTGGLAIEQGMEKYAITYLDQTLSESTYANGIREVLYKSISSMSKEDYHDVAKGCFMTDFSNNLRDINAPTLVLIGDQDFKTPIELSQFIHEQIYNSLLVKVPNAMHLSNVDNPFAFNDITSGFLKILNGGRSL